MQDGSRDGTTGQSRRYQLCPITPGGSFISGNTVQQSRRQDAFGNRVKQRPFRNTPIHPGGEKQKTSWLYLDHFSSQERPWNSLPGRVQCGCELFPGLGPIPGPCQANPVDRSHLLRAGLPTGQPGPVIQGHQARDIGHGLVVWSHGGIENRASILNNQSGQQGLGAICHGVPLAKQGGISNN